LKKKWWHLSGNRRDEVPLDRGPPGYLAGACHVRGAERVAVGLLCVAVTAGQPPQDRQSRVAGRHPAGPCATPGTIRRTAHPCRIARHGPNRQPQAGRIAPTRGPGITSGRGCSSRGGGILTGSVLPDLL